MRIYSTISIFAKQSSVCFMKNLPMQRRIEVTLYVSGYAVLYEWKCLSLCGFCGAV